MRKLLIAACVVLWAGVASAQIGYFKPGGGSGSADPSQFSSAAGTLTIGGSVGAVTIDADTSVIPTYASSTSSPGATCSPGEFFFETDLTLHICKATDVWAPLFTFVDDSVMIGTGTNTTPKTLPDCDDTTGQHLNYDTTTNAFSCGTSGDGTGASFDPGTQAELYEDFLSGGTSAGTAGTSGIGWVAVSTGTATFVNGTAANPGLLRLNSHASNDNSGEVVNWAFNIGGSQFLTSNDWTFDATLIVGSNSTAITAVTAQAGVWNSTVQVGTGQGTGVYIRYDTDAGDTTWMFQVCNASGASGCGAAGDGVNSAVMASTVTPSAGTAYRLRIRCVASGVGGTRTYYFRVNNETEKSACNNAGCTKNTTIAPTSPMYPSVGYLTRTTTGVMSGDLDYLYFKATSLARY